MKLIVADDDMISRTMLLAVCKKWGYDTLGAEDGEQAWEHWESLNEPVLMLIDWEMPRLDGLGLCRRIADKNKGCLPFIILLTSRNETDDVVMGLESGANDYIVKPFVNAELKERLNVGKRMLDLKLQLRKAMDVLTFERETIENIILKMRASKSFA